MTRLLRYPREGCKRPSFVECQRAFLSTWKIKVDADQVLVRLVHTTVVAPGCSSTNL